MPRKPASYDPTQISDIPLTLHTPDFLAAWTTAFDKLAPKL